MEMTNIENAERSLLLLLSEARLVGEMATKMKKSLESSEDACKELREALQQRDTEIKQLNQLIQAKETALEDSKRTEKVAVEKQKTLALALGEKTRDYTALHRVYDLLKKEKKEALSALAPLQAREQETQLQTVFYGNALDEIAALKKQIAELLQEKENAV
jgi:multidrug efflux pump subunit AcrB